MCTKIIFVDEEISFKKILNTTIIQNKLTKNNRIETNEKKVTIIRTIK